MTIEKLLFEKWAIKRNELLFDAEVAVARICTEMSNRPILFDKPRLKADVHQSFDATMDAKYQLRKTSNGKIIASMPTNRFKDFLLKEGVSQSTLDYATCQHPRGFLSLKGLQLIKDVHPAIPSFLEYNVLVRQHHTLSNLLERVWGDGTTTSYFDSTRSNSGVVWTSDLNLAVPFIEKYFKVPDDKVFLEVSIKDATMYMIANLLQDEKLLAIYNTEDPRKTLASKFFDVPVEFVTDAQRRMVTKVFQKLISTDFAGSSQGLDVLALARQSTNGADIAELFSTFYDRVNGLTDVTPHGRYLDFIHEGLRPYTDVNSPADYARIRMEFYERMQNNKRRSSARNYSFMKYFSAVTADFEKIVMHHLVDMANFKPVLWYCGNMVFEVDNTANIKQLTKTITKLYKDITPKGWIAPQVNVKVRTTYDPAVEPQPELDFVSDDPASKDDDEL